MLKVICVFSLLSFCYQLKAQLFVDGHDIEKKEIQFCEIVGEDLRTYNKKIVVLSENIHSKEVETTYSLSDKNTVVFIDIGEPIDWKVGQTITDKSGNEVVFHSTIDALNFLCCNGWEFVTSYSKAAENTSSKRFLLKKNPK
jgi:hypothetical protein